MKTIIILCFISVLYAHNNNFELALSTNFPYKEFNEYARLGQGLQLNIKRDSIFQKNKNISIVSSIQFSRFGSKNLETYIGNDSVEMKSIEKLLSFSLGPRYTFKNQFIIGFSLSQNLFYNKVTNNINWVDTEIGECDYNDIYYHGCEPNLFNELLWDLGINLFRESIEFIGSEVKGIFTSKNLYSGYKINAGILMDKTIFEVSYHTMPNLKYPILTNDGNNLLDFINADYMTVNIIFLFNK